MAINQKLISKYRADYSYFYNNHFVEVYSKPCYCLNVDRKYCNIITENQYRGYALQYLTLTQPVDKELFKSLAQECLEKAVEHPELKEFYMNAYKTYVKRGTDA